MSKIAVITGSSGGIGSALVQLYLQDDYVVIGLDRCPSGNTELDKFTELNPNLREFAKKESYRKKILNQIKSLLPDKFEKFVLINNAAEQIIKTVADIKLVKTSKIFSSPSAKRFEIIFSFIKSLFEFLTLISH